MKNFSKVFGIIALVAVIGLSMAACSMFGGDKGGFSAPKAADVKKLPGFPADATFVAGDKEAQDLLDGVVTDGLVTLLRNGLIKSTTKIWGKDADATITADTKAGPSVSYSVKHADTTELSSLCDNADGSGKVGASIKGTDKFSAKTNNPNLYSSARPAGYTYSASSSQKLTFTIDGLAKVGGYLVGGIITINDSDSVSIDKLAVETTVDDLKGNRNRKGVDKLSVALTIYDTATKKAAKIRWSDADQYVNKQKKVTGTSKFAESHFEVYDNSNALKFSALNYDNATLDYSFAISPFDYYFDDWGW